MSGATVLSKNGKRESHVTFLTIENHKNKYVTNGKAASLAVF